MVKKNKIEKEQEEELEEEVSEEERITPENVSGEKEQEEEKTPAEVKKNRNMEETTDYLKKYQYKQNCKLGADETNPDLGSKAARMKAHLLAQPRVRTMVPLDLNEDKNSKQSVCMNGYRLDFPKNTYIEIPEQIALKLSESLKQKEEALSLNRIDGHKDKENQLL